MPCENSVIVRVIMFIATAICWQMTAQADVGAISGLVTDASSEKIENAAVAALQAGSLIDVGVSDAEGGYTISNLDPGTYDLHVIATGYEMRVISGVVVNNGSTTTQNVESLADEGSIEGTVTEADGMTGLQNVQISVSIGTYTLSDFTDSIGNFKISNLKAGTYAVSATMTGYGFPNDESPVVTSGTAVTGVDLIGYNGVLSGKVTEPDGTTAIPGARVLAYNSLLENVASSTASPSGIYELKGLPSGIYSVKAFEGAQLLDAVAGVSVTSGQTTSNIDLLEQNGSISGSVADNESPPTAIPGAKVIAINMDTGGAIEAATDQSGNYTIASLAAGTYRVVVKKAGYEEKFIESIAVTESQNITGKNFALGSAGTVSGLIKDENNIAIEGAIVSASFEDGSGNVFVQSAVLTDGNGAYVLDRLPPSSSYIVVVGATGHVSDSEEGITVTAGATTSAIDFTLGTVGGSISGTVHEVDGTTPISGANVVCYSPGKSAAAATSDSNGAYSLDMLQDGTYQVSAHKVGFDGESLLNIVVTESQENDDNNFALDVE